MTQGMIGRTITNKKSLREGDFPRLTGRFR